MFYFGIISIILSTHVLVWEYRYYTKHTCFSFGLINVFIILHKYYISIILNTHKYFTCFSIWEHKYYTKHTNISIILNTCFTCFSFFGNISIILNTHVLLWEHKYYTKHTCFTLGT